MSQDTFYILLDKIRITDANAISGPLSYGFPSLNGFLGATHALERCLLNSDFPKVNFQGVLISCTRYQPKIDTSGHDATFILKRAPILKSGKTAPIIEEGYVNLTVSLVIKAFGDITEFLGSSTITSNLENIIKSQCLSLRFAGGVTEAVRDVKFYKTDEEDDIKKRLLPGFVLIDAEDDAVSIYSEMIDGYRSESSDHSPSPIPSNPNASVLDILLNTAIIHQIPPEDDSDEWQSYSFKAGRGWLVPIPVGYQAISQVYEAGEVKNARNPNYPAQFVEAVYALGKWVFPHRLDEFDKAFWNYTNALDNLYVIQP